MEKYNYVACSIHSNSPLYNIGDYLSAVSISSLYNTINSNVWLPIDDKIIEGNFIYGGGGMIRPNFHDREVYKHYKNIDGKHSIIGVGLNNDIKSGLEYSIKDLSAIKDWVEKAEYVSVRDFHTKSFLETEVLKGREKEIHIAPCPSYIYMRKFYTDAPNKVYKLGIVPSFGHTKSYQKFVPDIKGLIQELLNNYGDKNIILLCHDDNDYNCCKQLYGGVKTVKIKDFSDINKFYGSCNGVVTTRAHGIIFSSSVGVPCSYIHMADKLRYLYEYHYGKGDFPDKPIFDCDYHINHINQNFIPINR